MGIREKLRKFIGFNKSTDKISTGVHIGLSGAYITNIEGESFTRHHEKPDKIEGETRKSHYVVTGLSGQGILYKNVILPKDIRENEIEEAVKWQFYDIELSDYDFTYRHTDFSPDDNLNILCVAVPYKLIIEFGENNNNIYTALDLKSFAVWRGYKLSNPSDDATILIMSSHEGVTVIGGRSKIEFIRDIPASAKIDFEKLRSIDYYKQAFDAADAVVVELDGEQAAWFISAGYALSCEDPSFHNFLPEHYQRVKTLEFKKPRKNELLALTCAAVLLLSFAPLGLSHWYQAEANKHQEIANKYAYPAEQVTKMKKEIKNYHEWSRVVDSFYVIPYTLIVNDIRYATPPDVMLEKLEVVNSNEAPKDDGQQEKEQKKEKGTEKKKEQKSSGEKTTSALEKISYKPNTILIEGKSMSLKSIGLLADNIFQLTYVNKVVVSHTMYSDYYEFKLKAGFEVPVEF